MDLIAARLRRAGQGVVPSDNVVALARADLAGADGAYRSLRQATGSRYVVVPRIERSGNGWAVDMTLRADDGSSREARASGADPIETTRVWPATACSRCSARPRRPTAPASFRWRSSSNAPNRPC